MNKIELRLNDNYNTHLIRFDPLTCILYHLQKVNGSYHSPTIDTINSVAGPSGTHEMLHDNGYNISLILAVTEAES